MTDFPPLRPYEHAGRLQADCPACGMAGRVTSSGNGVVLFDCDADCGAGSGVYRDTRADPTETGADEKLARRAMDGAAFVFGEPEQVPAVWGEGLTVLWSAGEPLWAVAPQGVGKTTLTQQLVLRRCGIRTTTFLGYPVERDDRKVLYLALDRPRQIARSLRRMVSEDDRVALAERLVVWRGPLPFDLVAEPERLARFALEHDAGTLFIDAAKDMAMDLVKDEVGTRVNHALQHAVADGIEVCVNHHQRKASADNRQPRSLDDVYGSTWLTAGAGSVLLLWGEPGDVVVDLRHLKQPAEEVGPLRLLHDHERGETTLFGPRAGRAAGGHARRGERPRRRPRSVRGRQAEPEPGREGAAQAGGAGGRRRGRPHPRRSARPRPLRRKGAWVAVGTSVGHTRAIHAHPRFRFLEHPRSTHGHPRAAHHVRLPPFRGGLRVGVGPSEEGR